MEYGKKLKPLKTGCPSTGTLPNRGDPDEMCQNAQFHQGLHCLLRQKQTIFSERNTISFGSHLGCDHPINTLDKFIYSIGKLF